MPSWNEEYQLLMKDLDTNPYGCVNEYCNHSAKSTLGMIFHGRYGKHHMSHHLTGYEVTKETGESNG